MAPYEGDVDRDHLVGRVRQKCVDVGIRSMCVFHCAARNFRMAHAALATGACPWLVFFFCNSQRLSFFVSVVLQLDVDEICRLCTKMQLGPAVAAEVDGEAVVKVTVPPTRSDILHAVDIVEDVAIAYGFNK